MRKLGLETVLFSFIFVTASSAETAQWKFKVGFIAPLSGPAANYGTWAKTGFEMGLAEIKDSRLEVVFEDDQFKPADTVSAFKKLTQVDKVDLVISIGSTPSNAIAPLAEAARIPLIAWASDSKVSKGRAYVMRSYFSGEEEGAAIAAEIDRRGYQEVGVIVSVNDYTQSVRKGILAKLEAGKIKYDVEVPAEAVDFRPFILRAGALGVRQVFLCLNPGQFGLFAKQLRELKSDAQMIGCENIQAADELKIAAGSLEGAWFVTSAISQDFLGKYAEHLKGDTLVPAVAVHYDLAYLIYDAMLHAAAPKDVWQAVLGSEKRNTAVGSVGVANRGGDRFLDTARRVMLVTDNDFVQVH